MDERHETHIRRRLWLHQYVQSLPGEGVGAQSDLASVTRQLAATRMKRELSENLKRIVQCDNLFVYARTAHGSEEVLCSRHRSDTLKDEQRAHTRFALGASGRCLAKMTI